MGVKRTIAAALLLAALTSLLVSPVSAQGIEHLTGWQLEEKDAQGRYTKFLVLNNGNTSAIVSYVGYYFSSNKSIYWVDIPDNVLVINATMVISVPESYRSADRIYVLTTRGNSWPILMRPVADFTFSPSQPTPGVSVQFTDNSRDSDGWVVSWSWQFGDGSTSTKRNPSKQYAQNGIYLVTLTVVDDDGLTGTVTKTINVGSAPDFSLSANPNSGSVTQGNSANTIITATSLNGFSGSVTLSASGLPSGASTSFSTNPLSLSANGSANSTLTISTSSSTPTGTYSITVTGTSGSLSRSAVYMLTVNASGGGGGSYINISLSPNSGSVQRGDSANVTVSINSNLSGISLSASNVPTGVSVSFSPSSGNYDFSSTMTISTNSSASAGTYYITVTASSGGTSSSATYTLQILVTRIAVSINSLDAPVPSSAQVTVGSVTKTVYSGSPTYWDVSPGSYTVSFGSVSYYRTPSNQNVTVSSGQTVSVTGYYNIGKWRFLQAGDLGFIAAQEGKTNFYSLSNQQEVQPGKATIGLGWNNGDQFWSGGIVNINIDHGGLFISYSMSPTSTTPNANGTLITISNVKVTGTWASSTYPRLSGTSVNFPGYGGEGNRYYQDVGWTVYFP
ncbi:MAG: PKD domain-containing protein [Hadesarchaea archaeon]|nr:PKD domain-containing protein [Hadesarchaea archaeon]